MAKRNATRKKIVKKNIAKGIVYISASFNNTLVTVTDEMGNMIAWSSAGRTPCDHVTHFVSNRHKSVVE